MGSQVVICMKQLNKIWWQNVNIQSKIFYGQFFNFLRYFRKEPIKLSYPESKIMRVSKFIYHLFLTTFPGRFNSDTTRAHRARACYWTFSCHSESRKASKAREDKENKRQREKEINKKLYKEIEWEERTQKIKRSTEISISIRTSWTYLYVSANNRFLKCTYSHLGLKGRKKVMALPCSLVFLL